MPVIDASPATSTFARPLRAGTRQPPAVLQQALMRAARALLFPGAGVLDGLPVAQARCLQEVARTEGRKMRDLADELEIKLPALSQIVDRLARRGLLERRADPLDRRVVRLHLTVSGRALLDEAGRRRTRHMEDVLDRLEPEVAWRLVADLNQLADAGESLQEVSCATLDGPDPMADLLAQRARVRRGASAAE